jgi:hypothetical protein
MELVPTIGVGVSDLQHAVRAEVERIIKETKGDALAQSKLLIRMLRERNLINDKEVKTLSQIAEAGHKSAAGKKSAHAAYFEVRELYNMLLASPGTSPVALVLASSAVGSYSTTQGSDGKTVVFKASTGGWEGSGRCGHWQHMGPPRGRGRRRSRWPGRSCRRRMHEVVFLRRNLCALYHSCAGRGDRICAHYLLVTPSFGLR